MHDIAAVCDALIVAQFAFNRDGVAGKTGVHGRTAGAQILAKAAPADTSCNRGRINLITHSLAQASSSPLGIPDSDTNLLLLYDLPTHAGGTPWGIFAWNYNVKQQGLYNYSRTTTYDQHNLDCFGTEHGH